MWVDKDDVFTDNKIQEFKASNPESETHIRSASSAKSPHSSAPVLPHLLYQHALCHMSSDGNNDLAYKYPIGAMADSPIPFSQTNPIDTPVVVPIPIVDFTTMQPLNPTAVSIVLDLSLRPPQPRTSQPCSEPSASTHLLLSHPMANVSLAKPAKCLLFRSPLPKGEGVKQALAWNREQLLDLR
jgi:hypothetical protein